MFANVILFLLHPHRYVVGSNRVLMVVRDGALAWDVKKFLLSQDNCELVTIEGKDYYNDDNKVCEFNKHFYI